MELVVMLETTVLPELATAGGAVIVSRVVKVAETPESEVASRLRGLIERLDRDPTATVALLASAGEVRVRITAKDADRPRAEARLDPVEDEIRGLLGPAVFGGAGDTLEGVVAGMLRSRGLSLALAESVTGGMVASRLVSVPGTSEFLAGSYVAYSADRKVHDLGVPALTLQRHGAVSAETAVAMAEGARRRTGADLGLSTTGEAGPEPAEAPVGTIYLGMAWAGGSASRRLLVPGERETIRRWASQGALNTVRRWLAEAGPSAG